MLTNVIRQLLKEDPFRPFTMSLSSRTTVRIARASMAKVSDTGDVLYTYDLDGKETGLISIRHVCSITPDAPPDEPVVVKL